MRLALILSAERARRGWSLRDAAQRLDCSHTALLHVESGKRICGAPLLLKAARVYGDDVGALSRLWAADRLDAAQERIEAERARIFGGAS